MAEGPQGHGPLESRGEEVQSFSGIVHGCFPEKVVEEEEVAAEEGRGGTFRCSKQHVQGSGLPAPQCKGDCSHPRRRV